jgi:hypothetical protein
MGHKELGVDTLTPEKVFKGRGARRRGAEGRAGGGTWRREAAGGAKHTARKKADSISMFHNVAVKVQ